MEGTLPSLIVVFGTLLFVVFLCDSLVYVGLGGMCGLGLGVLSGLDLCGLSSLGLTRLGESVALGVSRLFGGLGLGDRFFGWGGLGSLSFFLVGFEWHLVPILLG